MKFNCSAAVAALSSALGAALHRDLSPVEVVVHDYDKVAELRKVPGAFAKYREENDGEWPRKTVVRSPDSSHVEVTLFAQTWGSTGLGYVMPGEMCASAMTPAYTIVASTRNESCVYFGGDELAYRVVYKDMTEAQRSAWEEDLKTHMLRGKAAAASVYGAELPPDCEIPEDV